MPNWCENTLYLENKDEKAIDALIAVLQQDDAELFQHLRPMPKDTFRGNLGNDEREECERKGIPNWYDWSILNWGTKWDATDIMYDVTSNNSIRLHFNTAWGPPTQLYEYMVSNGWDVDAYYVEWGMDYCGRWHDGEELYVNSMSEDGIPQEIDEELELSEQIAMMQDEDEVA